MSGLTEQWLALPDVPLNALAGFGVSIESALTCNGIAAAKVRPIDRLFELDAAGVHAWVLPVFDDETDDGPLLADLVAFDPQQPGQWWQYRGEHGLAVGQGQIASAAYWGNQLYLYSTPLSWLRGSCQGACLLDTRHTQLALGGVPSVLCETLPLAERVGAALKLPDPFVPKIFVNRLEAA